MRSVCNILLLILAAAVPLTAGAEDSYDEYELKAAIVYNVAKFVKWPAGTFAGDKTPLTICVMGSDREVSRFASIDGKSIGRRPVRVKPLQTLEDCQQGQILYLARSEAKRLEGRLADLSELPVLTVSDAEGFAGMGGMVELVNSRGNIRFAINLDATTVAKLKLSSKLNALATKVIRSKNDQG